MAEPKIVFLDTNIYLHYQPFDQINWLDILKVKDVRIIVPPVTLRELNKIKDTHSRSLIRTRARDVIQRLSVLFSNSDVAILRKGIEMYQEADDPIFDFASYHLSKEVQDDQLIAAIIAYQKKSAGTDILLITSDAGLTLTTKARRRERIQAVPCPENLKLPAQPDPDQVRIRELEAKLEKFTYRLPQLNLEFVNGDKHITFSLVQPNELTPNEVQQAIEEVKLKHSKRETLSRKPRSEKKGGLKLDALFADIQSPLSYISQEDIAEYNVRITEFYVRYVDYVKAQRAFEIVQARLVKLEIQLMNEGTAPAKDVDVFMHVPDGLTLLSKVEVPESPIAPKPPSLPKSAWQKITEGFDFGTPTLYPYSFGSSNVETPSNVSAPYIKRTNSYEVGVHVKKAKHLLPERLDPLFIMFDTFEGASSFHIEYELFSDDLPDKVSGQLHVVIRK